MTGRELIRWLLDSDELLADDVLDMEIEYQTGDGIAFPVHSASVQGNKIQLY